MEKGEVFFDKNNENLDLSSYDFLIHEDDNTKDVISISDAIKKPKLYQLINENKKHLNITVIPYNLGIWEGTRKESYIPISMTIVTNAKPITELGKNLANNLFEKMFPEEIAYHYLGVSKELLDGDEFENTYKKIRNNSDVGNRKKLNLLYIVGCELYPKAMYMLLKQKFCNDTNIAEILNISNSITDYNMISKAMQNDNVSQKDVEEIYKSIEKKVNNAYRKEYGECAKLNLKIMKQNI